MEMNVEWIMAKFGKSEAEAKKMLEIHNKDSQDYMNSLKKPEKDKCNIAVITIYAVSDGKQISCHCSNEECYRDKVISDIKESGADKLSVFITRNVQEYLSYKNIWTSDGIIQNIYDFSDISIDQAVLALSDLTLRIRLARMSTLLSQRSFAKELNIPYRSIENWESGQRVPPEYVVELIEYKLENKRQKMFSRNEKRYEK